MATQSLASMYFIKNLTDVAGDASKLILMLANNQSTVEYKSYDVACQSLSQSIGSPDQ